MSRWDTGKGRDIWLRPNRVSSWDGVVVLVVGMQFPVVGWTSFLFLGVVMEVISM